MISLLKLENKRRRRLRKMALHLSAAHRELGSYRIFGDSHVLYMCWRWEDAFEAHWIGPRTAHMLCSHQDAFVQYIREDKPNLFLFGAIDVRYHIPREPCTKTTAAIEDTVKRYVSTVRGVCPRAVIVSIVPPPLGGRDFARHDEMVRQFNTALRDHCVGASLRFLDVHPAWCTFRVQGNAYADSTHMREAAGLLLLSAIKEAPDLRMS